MTLAELIDLEAQLARDRATDPAALEARDAGSALSTADRSSRRSLLRRWLEVRRQSDSGQLYPGRAVAGVLRGIGAVLATLGLLFGWSAATALLSAGNLNVSAMRGCAANASSREVKPLSYVTGASCIWRRPAMVSTGSARAIFS